jgi:hypothetical protein
MEPAACRKRFRRAERHRAVFQLASHRGVLDESFVDYVDTFVGFATTPVKM